MKFSLKRNRVFHLNNREVNNYSILKICLKIMFCYEIVVILCFVVINFGKCEVIDMSCQDIHDIVDGHNNRRSQLALGEISGQPRATNMKYMVWDTELAAKAANWASIGQFSHNPDRTIESGRFETGENIYYYTTTDSSYKFNMDTALASWFSENEYWTFGKLTTEDFMRPSDSEIGHYTQMAWADSTYIGCGLDKRSENGWTTFLVVCNYGPAGNMIGSEPYSTEGDNTSLLCGENCDNLYGDC